MRSTRLACAALGLTALLALGCGSACQDLADRICECEPAGTLRDQCKSGVKNQLSSGAQQPTDADQERCRTLLDTCVDTPGLKICDFVETPAGKTACGLAY